MLDLIINYLNHADIVTVELNIYIKNVMFDLIIKYLNHANIVTFDLNIYVRQYLNIWFGPYILFKQCLNF